MELNKDHISTKTLEESERRGAESEKPNTSETLDSSQENLNDNKSLPEPTPITPIDPPSNQKPVSHNISTNVALGFAGSSIFAKLKDQNHQNLKLNAFMPQYQELQALLEFYFSFNQEKAEENLEENTKDKTEEKAEDSSVSINRSLFKGKILIKSLPGHAIKIFLEKYSSESKIPVYFINMVALFEKPLEKIFFLGDQIDKQLEIQNLLIPQNSSGIGANSIIVMDFSTKSNPLTHLSSIIDHSGKLISEPILWGYITQAIESIRNLEKKCIFLVILPTNSMIPSHLFDFTLNIVPPAQEARMALIQSILGPTTPLDWHHLANICNSLTNDEIIETFEQIHRYFLFQAQTHTNVQLDNKFVIQFLENPLYRENQNVDSLQLPQSENNPAQNQSRWNATYENQLLQDLVSKNYNEIIIVIDKLNKGLKLASSELKLLGDYPILLQYNPDTMFQKISQAKMRIDRINQLQK